MSLGPDDLVLCAGTLASTPLAERAEAAASAGFQALSLFLDDLDGARQSGLSDADIRSLLAANGLAIAELDPLLSWASGAPDPRVTAELETLGAGRQRQPDGTARHFQLG